MAEQGSKLPLVVLGVSANPLDQDHTVLILGLDDQPVGVALDVENHFVICQKAGTGVSPFDLLRACPLSSLSFRSPGVERPARIRVVAFELVKLYEAK